MSIVSRNESDKCPECGGILSFDSRRSEVTCHDCGLVVEENIIDAYPEISEGKIQREEPVKDKIYPQYVFGSKDSSGKPVDREWRRRRSRTASVFNLKPEDRIRLKITRDIKQVCSIYGLPQAIADRAIFIYRKTIENRLIVKPSMRDLSLASIIAACRERRIFIDVAKICEDYVGRPATPLRYCHIISRGLGLKVSIPNAENYISKFVSDFGEEREIEKEAIRIVRLYNGINVNSKCLAAAATYLACSNLGRKKTQREVKDITAVSEVTLRTWTATLKLLPGAIREIMKIDEVLDIDQIQD